MYYPNVPLVQTRASCALPKAFSAGFFPVMNAATVRVYLSLIRILAPIRLHYTSGNICIELRAHCWLRVAMEYGLGLLPSMPIADPG
jgi:hypothetical protein